MNRDYMELNAMPLAAPRPKRTVAEAEAMWKQAVKAAGLELEAAKESHAQYQDGQSLRELKRAKLDLEIAEENLHDFYHGGE